MIPHKGSRTRIQPLHRDIGGSMWDPRKDPQNLGEEYSPDQNDFFNAFAKYLTTLY